MFAALTREIAEEGLGDDWEEPNADQAESVPQSGDEPLLLYLLGEAGRAGVGRGSCSSSSSITAL
jgi:hypothetical protein